MSTGTTSEARIAQLERELEEAKTLLHKREADIANLMLDLGALMRLLHDIRMATDDRGKRNAAELVDYCAELAARAALAPAPSEETELKEAVS